MEENIILSDGEHMLSGVSLILTDWGYNYVDAVLLTIDGKNYIALEDPEDGYRSYGVFHQTDRDYHQRNSFPPQKVFVKNVIENSWVEEMHEVYQYRGIEITNEAGDLILRVGTDLTDDYYPMACFKYNPENLPINMQSSEIVEDEPEDEESEDDADEDHPFIGPQNDFYEYLDRYGSNAFAVAIVEMLQAGELSVTWEQAQALWERGGKTS